MSAAGKSALNGARLTAPSPGVLTRSNISRQRLVLGQEAVAEKSNEITAIPLLLQRLELTGAQRRTFTRLRWCTTRPVIDDVCMLQGQARP